MTIAVEEDYNMRDNCSPLQQEFRQSHGNSDAVGYWHDHGPRYANAYVEWLEDLVQQLRTRPDLSPHDEPHWPADV